MLGAVVKKLNDENAAENCNQVQVKKLTVPAKRDALGDIQNQEHDRKDVAVKKVKISVDTHWKKQSVGVSNANLGTTKTNLQAAGAAAKQKKMFVFDPPVLLPSLAKQPQLPAPSCATAAQPMATVVSQFSKCLAFVEDIDAEDRHNPFLVPEYVNDIYSYLYELEDKFPIQPNHLAHQLEVSSRMRSMLIDWINGVHNQFQLVPETFQLTVAIIDRYLQAVKTTKSTQLQLLGVTALFTATKYEELWPRAIADFVFITDNTYTAHDIRLMELQILQAIDCNLSRPLPIHFLRRYSKAAHVEHTHHAMSKYFLELCAMDYELASCKPSEIAAASLFLSLHLLNGYYRIPTGFNDMHWTPTMVHYSRYTAQHLRPIAHQIAKLAVLAPTEKLKSVYCKYQANKFVNISLRQELSGLLMESIVGTTTK